MGPVARRSLANVYRLGVKELWSLWRDPVMLVLIVYAFTVGIYTAATAMPETLHDAPIAIVDEDRSQLSGRIASALHPPQFRPPAPIPMTLVDPAMDAGDYTFVLVIPVDFQRKVLAGEPVALQLNVDATRMSQAFLGSGFVQQVVMGEVAEFLQRYRGEASPPVSLALRARFNPSLEQSWFGGLMEVINNVAMLSIILTGAALIREREHGTIEHLLVMPVTPTEIMLAKVWSMGLVVLLAAGVALEAVVRGALAVPVEGSTLLFLAGAAVCFMATIARSMPQFGLLLMLTLMPLQMLSGGMTPRESMPPFVRELMLAAPTTHFVELGQAILFRGAGLDVVWPQLVAMAAIGAILFHFALRRFRRTISRLA
jgi:ABC-2 type transport system permease protein